MLVILDDLSSCILWHIGLSCKDVSCTQFSNANVSFNSAVENHMNFDRTDDEDVWFSKGIFQYVSI